MFSRLRNSSQREPFTTFPGRLVMTEAIGLIDACPIDDFPSVLGDDMKEVKDDLRLRAIAVNLQLVGGGHIHAYRVDSPTALLA